MYLPSKARTSGSVILNFPVAARGGRFCAAELDAPLDGQGKGLFHGGGKPLDPLAITRFVLRRGDHRPDDEQAGLALLKPDAPQGEVSVQESRVEVVPKNLRPGESFFRVIDTEPDIGVGGHACLAGGLPTVRGIRRKSISMSTGMSQKRPTRRAARRGATPLDAGFRKSMTRRSLTLRTFAASRTVL